MQQRCYPEHFVQCEFAQLRPHGGLRQLRDGILWILHAVTSLGAHTENAEFYDRTTTKRGRGRELFQRGVP